MPELSRIEALAYTAGLLDGEGSFSIQKSSGTYRTTIQVSMTNREVVFWLYSQYGGHFSKRDATATTEELYLWVLASKPRIAELVPRLLPYLIVKKLSATILLEFCLKFNVGRAGRYTSQQYVEIDKYHQLIMLANSKGPNSNAVKDRILSLVQGEQNA